MKPRSILLVSLGLNLALGGVVAFIVLRHRPATGGPAAIPEAAMQPPAASTTPSPTPSESSVPAPVPPSFHWRQIESADYRQYIANLQAVGCPERTIRDIIVSDIDQLYAAKDKSAPVDSPPWRNADHRRADDRTRAEKSFALRVEKRALVKELIGYEWDNLANEVWHEDFLAGLLLGFLPDLKAPQVMSLASKYADTAAGVKARANNILIEEDRVQLRKLHDDLVAEVSRLLTPQERDELELRVQASIFLPARNIQWNGVSITGNELREYIRRSLAFEDRFAMETFGSGTPSHEDEALKSADFEKAVKNMLGSKRFAEYQRAQDPGFREAYEFAQERHLPANAAIRIYETRRLAEDQAGAVQRNSALSAEERTAAFTALKGATAGTISSVLGKSFGEYLEGPGQWLETLGPNAGTQ